MIRVQYLLLQLLTWLAVAQAGREAYTNCTFPPLCRDRPPSGPRPVDETYHVPREPCSCDHTCQLYGNCCSDAPGHVFSSSERNILGRTDGEPWACRYLVPLAVDPDSKPVFMVDWCPPQTNELLHAKCSKDPSIVLFNYTHLLDVPVVSSNSGLIYQNVFCGTCHNEHYFRAYDFNLSCDCEVTGIEELFSLLYAVGNLTWRGPRPQDLRCKNLDTITCKLHVTFPEQTGQRCEENLVHSCSNGGMFKSFLNEDCVNGTNYYLQDRESNVYKNINCALCNGKSLNEVICLQPDKFFSPSGVQEKALWTISDLFSFDDHCDLNHVDDPVFGQCDMYVNVPDEIHNGTHGNDTSKNTTITQPMPPGSSTASVFFVVVMAISIVCLLLHNIIFLILFKDRNLHSTNLFSMTCALFLADTFFVFGPNLCASYQSCYVLTIFVYYFFIAAFLWMNVMSVDICKTFHSQSIHSHKVRTFAWYSLYAWGLALLITFCALMVDNFASESAVSPGFADKGFWFGSTGGLLMFFVIPVEVLFAFNTALLLASAKEIQKQKKMGKIASSSATSMKKLSKLRSQKTNDDNDEEPKIYRLITGKVKKTLSDHKEQVAKLKLYACLTVLMGVPWIFGVLTNFSVVFEYLFNFFTSLQGVFVFLAFDCNRKVWASLKAVFSSKSSSTNYSVSQSTESDKASLSSSRFNSTGRGQKGPKRSRGQSSASKTTVDTIISQEPDSDVEVRNNAYKKENELERNNASQEVYDIGDPNLNTYEREPALHKSNSRNISSFPYNTEDLPISYQEANSMNLQHNEDSNRVVPTLGVTAERNIPAGMHSHDFGSPKRNFTAKRHEESEGRSPELRSSAYPNRSVARHGEDETEARYSDSRHDNAGTPGQYNDKRKDEAVGRYSDNRQDNAGTPGQYNDKRKDEAVGRYSDNRQDNAGTPGQYNDKRKDEAVGRYSDGRQSEAGIVGRYSDVSKSEAATIGLYSDSSDERFEDDQRTRPQKSRRKRRTRKKKDQSEHIGDPSQAWKMNYSMKRAIESSEEEDIIDI